VLGPASINASPRPNDRQRGRAWKLRQRMKFELGQPRARFVVPLFAKNRSTAGHPENRERPKSSKNDATCGPPNVTQVAGG
jgi:hypothetical protein